MRFLDTITYRHSAPVLRKTYVRCLWASVAAILFTLTFITVREFRHWPRSAWTVAPPLLAGFMPACVILPLGWYLRSRVRREWRIARGRLCTHCAYNLSSLAAAGTCPECGNAYDVAADAALWTKAGFKDGVQS